jgi:CHAT domain-containing protein/Tfp pilus assembly protein PilF
MWNLALGLLLAGRFSEESFTQIPSQIPTQASIEQINLAQNNVLSAVELHQQGIQQFQQGQFSQAIATYQQALSLAPPQSALAANLLSQLGHAYANQGEYETALTLLDDAQGRYETLGLTLGLAEVDIYRSFVRRRQGDNDEALALLTAAQTRLGADSATDSATDELEAESTVLPQWRQLLTGEALHNLAAVRAAMGDSEQAIALNHQALAIWQTLQPAPGYPLTQRFHQGRSLNNLGGIYYTLGNFSQAQTFYAQALTIAQAIHNRATEGRVLTNLGQLDRQAGEYEQAKQRYLAALSVLTEIGDQASVSSTHNSLGIIYTALGEEELALESYQAGMAIAQEIGDRYQIGNLWDSFGGLYYQQAHYGKALAAYESALEIHQSISNHPGTASTLNNLGGTYAALGRDEEALDYFERAIALNDPVSQVGTLAAQGGLYQRLGQLPEALEATQRGLALSKQVGGRPLQGRLLDQLGSLYAQLGQIEPATSAYQSALEIADSSADLAAIGGTLNSLANLAAEQNDLEQARSLFQSALSSFQQIGDGEAFQGNRQGESVVLSNLGKIYEEDDQPVLAILFYKQAIARHESIRGDLRSLPNDLQQSYLDSITPTYRQLADLLLQQDRVLEAQQVIDLLKVQELDDYLRGVRGENVPQEGVEALASERQIWAEYEDLSEGAIAIAQNLMALSRLDRPLTTEETQQKAELDEQQRQIVRQFREFSRRDDIVGYTEALSRSAQEQSLSLPQLQDLSQNLRDLQQPTVLLYPLILEDRLELILVAPGVPPIHKTVPVDRLTLNKTIQAFRSDLTSPASDPLPAAQQLYDWLIRPVESQLTQAQAETILYAPDGPLRYIPLAALHNGNNWLIEQFNINNITAASIDDLTRTAPTDRRILAGAFSDPNTHYEISSGERTLGFSGLPYAGIEVKTLQSLQPASTAYFDPDFSKASILPNMDDYSIVHLATHAAFLPGSPLDSFILLGNGETITLQEVQDEWFFSNLDLIVLSACQTAVSSLGDSGEEILGFGYLMQNAGVNAAMASLWTVDDGGTQTLMSAFYATLLQTDVTKTEALRQAQLTLIHQGNSLQSQPNRGITLIAQNNETEPQTWSRLSHPYYWSPFVLIGNGL